MIVKARRGQIFVERSARLGNLSSSTVRWLLLCFFLAGIPPVFAQSDVIQEFSGSGSTTTGFFAAPNDWEVRWNARQVVSVAVMASDGTIVAGAAGVLRGSLFVPVGGQYYLKIADGGTGPDAPTSEMSWHVQVVPVGAKASAATALSVFTPYFVPPNTAVAPAAATAVSSEAIAQQATSAVVVVHGDRSQGAGFLLKTADGLFVVTHLDLLAANPHLVVTTVTGKPVPIGKLEGAADRDLALLAVGTPNLDHLVLPDNLEATVKSEDTVLVPDVGDDGQVTTGRTVRIGTVSPGKIDFDDRLESSCVGAPAVQEKSGDAVAIATATPRVDLSRQVSQAWPLNPDPDAARLIPYFGLRIDDVPGWETYDPVRFLNETRFLAQFHRETRLLDSYLNGGGSHHHGYDDGSGAPDANYFRNSEKIEAAQEHYRQGALGADREGRMDAARQLLFELETVVDVNLDEVRAMNSPYTYDRDRAREELAYRRALKEQLDGYQDDIESLDAVARSH
jgi:hypothetical protein